MAFLIGIVLALSIAGFKHSLWLVVDVAAAACLAWLLSDSRMRAAPRSVSLK